MVEEGRFRRLSPLTRMAEGFIDLRDSTFGDLMSSRASAVVKRSNIASGIRNCICRLDGADMDQVQSFDVSPVPSPAAARGLSHVPIVAR